MEQIKTINASRRSELRKDDRYIHVMKYMGSKRELLPDIREEVQKVLKRGDGILDIFAGTGSVGLYLKDDYTILSNDIQSYSSVIADALICSSNTPLSFDEKILESVKADFKKNRAALIKMLKATVASSEVFVNVPKRAWTENLRKQYVKFADSFPSPTNEFDCRDKEKTALYKGFEERTKSPLKFPYLQTTFLFAETYFSTTQCIDIDSIRYAIDQNFKTTVEKNIALTALIYAYSYCSSGTGHFAMFRDLKTVKSVNDVFLYRDRSVWAYFEKKFNEILNFVDYNPDANHGTFSVDFEKLLADKSAMRRVKLIYADPPYSFVHYSRFYHATESLVRYDYGLPEHKGRYRTDRHQSPFCQKQNVEKAFETLIAAASKYKKYLLLSYADTGMITLQRIGDILDDHGMRYDVREVNYDHSTMGREGHKSNQIKELLILAKPMPTN